MKQIRRFSRTLRNNSTNTESYLWQYLRRKQIDGLKFRRQHPIGKYIVDFICLEKKLIIEVDGGQHAINQVYDRTRDEWLRKEGYRVLRFWDNEVFNNLEGVLERIRSALLNHHPSSLSDPHPASPTFVGEEENKESAIIGERDIGQSLTRKMTVDKIAIARGGIVKSDIIIQQHQNFEDYAHQIDGEEFWLARELQTLLGYTQWRNFELVIDKAKMACGTAGHSSSDYFADVSKTMLQQECT